jgi:carboxyl-terminal processing protease
LQFQIDNVTGIGIQFIHDQETGTVTILMPMENTAAQKAGLLPQDIIMTIDGKPVDGLDLHTVVTMLQGKVGTSVTLGILRKGQPITFRVQRTKMEEIISVRYRVQETERGRIGYIRLAEFHTKATQVMKAAIEALEKQNVKGYVFDLRSNPGGLLQESRDITRMWLSNGVIINLVDRDGKRQQVLANNRALTQKPLVVLVDGNTANASEILAAALQENQRALLVGKRTFGFNSIYLMRELQNGTGFRMKTHKWLTPAGRDINRTGLNPDVVVEVTDSQWQDLFREGKIGTTADPQFAKALEILNQKLLVS